MEAPIRIEGKAGAGAGGKPTLETAREVLGRVVDPEIPALTIAEIGILRDVQVAGDTVTVTITPTYSGCPAMVMIEVDIRDTLLAAGFKAVEVKTALAPAWTTDWMSESAHGKLRALGIAPPEGKAAGNSCGAGFGVSLGDDFAPPCPRCGSADTALLSRFGSTACKALCRCNGCGEPFDWFKCI